MGQYIKKSTLVAEIEKKLTDILTCKKDASTPEERIALTNMLRLCKEILSFINTLEVKEVDLEKALSDLDKDIKEFVTTEEFENESTTAGHYWVIAKHAFLLGLKAQKGE